MPEVSGAQDVAPAGRPDDADPLHVDDARAEPHQDLTARDEGPLLQGGSIGIGPVAGRSVLDAAEPKDGTRAEPAASPEMPVVSRSIITGADAARDETDPLPEAGSTRDHAASGAVLPPALDRTRSSAASRSPDARPSERPTATGTVQRITGSWMPSTPHSRGPDGSAPLIGHPATAGLLVASRTVQRTSGREVPAGGRDATTGPFTTEPARTATVFASIETPGAAPRARTGSAGFPTSATFPRPATPGTARQAVQSTVQRSLPTAQRVAPTSADRLDAQVPEPRAVDQPEVQRSESGPVPSAPAEPTPAPAPSAAAPGSPGATATTGPATPEQLDELARRLVGPLTRQLKANLLLDRERRGQRTDAR